MIDSVFDYLLYHPKIAIGGTLATVFIIVAICVIVENNQARECVANGGTWTQTGTNTVWVTHFIGKNTIMIPQQVPVYGCVGAKEGGSK